jgi:hypothetical protein
MLSNRHRQPINALSLPPNLGDLLLELHCRICQEECAAAWNLAEICAAVGSCEAWVPYHFDIDVDGAADVEEGLLGPN